MCSLIRAVADNVFYNMLEGIGIIVTQGNKVTVNGRTDWGNTPVSLVLFQDDGDGGWVPQALFSNSAPTTTT